MKYVYINPDFSTGSVVHEYDPRFPDVPIAKRYSQSFLQRCVVVPDDTEIKERYDPTTKTFYSPSNSPIEQLRAEYDALILDQAFRITLLELGVN